MVTRGGSARLLEESERWVPYLSTHHRSEAPMVKQINSVQDVLDFLATVSPQLAEQCAAEFEAVWNDVAELDEPKPDAGPTRT